MSSPRYEAYKDSGVEWLGEVPVHWRVLPLKRIVSSPITDGPHETPKLYSEGIPFVSAEAVSSGKIDFEKIRGFISVEDDEKFSQKYRPQRLDVFMVKSGATTGITAIVETDIRFNIWSPLAAIRCGNDANPYFILNFMRSRNFQEAVALNWSFGTQQNIGMGVIENLPVAQPPRHEQTAIAAFLDRETGKIDRLIQEQQRLIELLKEKRQAVISHAVTKGLNPDAPMKDSGAEWLGEVPEHWEVKRLGRLCQKIGSGKTPKGGAEVYEPEGVLFLRSQNIYDEGLSLAEVVYISDDIDEEMSSTRVLPGDILLNITGASLGRTCIVPTKFGPANVNQHVCIIRLHEPSLRPFVALAMKSSSTKAQIDATQNGAAREGLNFEQIAALKLAIPHSTELEAICAHVENEASRFGNLVSQAQSAISLLQERRSALISAAVTGKIDVRGLVSLEAEAA